ncbi:MAG: hypothetical protein ITG00_11760 [Flavobacterium sp.]|nr:hypothetical protein [Flavobacterium sp.]
MNLAYDNFKRFAFLPGSDYIASENALRAILQIIDDFKIKSILELGMGIGSIADTVLKHMPEIYYTGTEANEFCLDALPDNVEDYNKVNLFNSLNDIKDGRQYDLIIIDGSDASLQQITRFSHENTIFFVEGFRGEQVKLLRKIFTDSLHVEIISNKKNREYGPFPSDRWMGGAQLIFINPTFYKRFYWFKEKVRSFIIRRTRKDSK